MQDVHSNEVIKDLTLNILKSDFGQECCQIVELLQFKGRLSLKELEREMMAKRMEDSHSNNRFDSFKNGNCGVAATKKLVGLDLKIFREHLRKNLFILMQHSIITYYSSAERGGKGGVYYQVNIQNIMARIRYARYINAAKKLLSENEAELITLALIHGRLQAKDFVTLANMDPIVAKQSFQTLISNNLLCSASPQESRTAIDIVMDEVRVELESKGPALTGAEIKKVGLVMKSKRKGDELELAEKASKYRRYHAEDWNDEALEGSKFFKINVLQFHLLLRGQYISTLAEERVNPTAGELVRVIYDLLYNSMFLLDQNVTDSVKIFEIHNAVRKADLTIPPTGNTNNPLEEYLNLMTTSHAPILTRDHDKFSLRIGDIMKGIKNQILCDIVKERCGPVAHRIWRLLDMKEKLDDKQISKMVLVEEKSARNALYQMLRLGLVFIQDVPKTIDHSANRTMFLWFVDVPRTIACLLQNCYKSINNLLLRREAELEKKKGLLEKSQRSDILSGEASLAPQETASIERVNVVLERIGVGIARLDELCMIIREF